MPHIIKEYKTTTPLEENLTSVKPFQISFKIFLILRGIKIIERYAK